MLEAAHDARPQPHDGGEMFSSVEARALSVTALPAVHSRDRPAGLAVDTAQRPRQQVDRLFLLVLLLPLFLWLVGPTGLLFDAPGWIDASVYVGYFLHYDQHLPLMEDHYKVSRLPWILPGYVAYHAAGPLLGNHILQLAVLTFTLGALYLTLRDLLEPRAAFIACTLLGFYPWFLHNGGAPTGGGSYHMTITTCYYLLTNLCLIRCLRSASPAGWALTMGASFACAMHTHLFMVVLAPGLGLCHVLLSSGHTWKRRITAWVIAFQGGVAITFVLACINRLTGGEFLFFLRQIRYTLRLASMGNHWHKEAASWLPKATWLVLPAATVLACSLSWLVLRRLGSKLAVDAARAHDRPRTTAVGALRVVCSLQIPFLLAVAAGCYYEFIKKQTVLDAGYMSAYLIGPMVLALGAFIYLIRPGLDRMTLPWLAGSAVVLMLWPWLLPPTAGGWVWKTLWKAAPVTQYGASLSLTGVASIGILAMYCFRRSAMGILLGLACIGAANGLDLHLHEKSRGSAHLTRDTFEFVIEADAFTASLDPSLSDIKYWFDREETAYSGSVPIRPARIFDNYVSTRCWFGNLFGGYPSPIPEKVGREHLGSFRRLAILSTSTHHARYAERFESRFRELGKNLTLQASRRFQHGDLDVTMTVFWIGKPPDG
jgi:hypothetical protein